MSKEHFFKKELARLIEEKNQIEDKIFELKNKQEKYEIEERRKQAEETQKEFRKSFLLANSVPIKRVELEYFDGDYFIVANDGAFTYVVRLDSDQAETFADELDAEINKQHAIIQEQFSIVNNMFQPLIDQVTRKSTDGKH